MEAEGKVPVETLSFGAEPDDDADRNKVIENLDEEPFNATDFGHAEAGNFESELERKKDAMAQKAAWALRH